VGKNRYFEVWFFAVLAGFLAIVIFALQFVAAVREKPIEIAAGEFIGDFGITSAENIKTHFVPAATEGPDWNDDYDMAKACIRSFGTIVDSDPPHFSHSSKLEAASMQYSDSEETDVFIVFSEYEDGNARFELEYITKGTAARLQRARFSATCQGADSSEELDLEFPQLAETE